MPWQVQHLSTEALRLHFPPPDEQGKGLLRSLLALTKAAAWRGGRCRDDGISYWIPLTRSILVAVVPTNGFSNTFHHAVWRNSSYLKDTAQVTHQQQVHLTTVTGKVQLCNHQFCCMLNMNDRWPTETPPGSSFLSGKERYRAELPHTCAETYLPTLILHWIASTGDSRSLVSQATTPLLSPCPGFLLHIHTGDCLTRYHNSPILAKSQKVMAGVQAGE